MITSDEKVSLINIGSGAAVEKFDDELQRVMADLADVNKDPTAERAITLKVTFKPTATQGIVSVVIACDPKLSKHLAFPTHLMIGHNGKKYEAHEMIQQQKLEFGPGVSGEGIASSKVTPIDGFSKTSL